MSSIANLTFFCEVIENPRKQMPAASKQNPVREIHEADEADQTGPAPLHDGCEDVNKFFRLHPNSCPCSRAYSSILLDQSMEGLFPQFLFFSTPFSPGHRNFLP